MATNKDCPIKHALDAVYEAVLKQKGETEDHLTQMTGEYNTVSQQYKNHLNNYNVIYQPQMNDLKEEVRVLKAKVTKLEQEKNEALANVAKLNKEMNEVEVRYEDASDEKTRIAQYICHVALENGCHCIDDGTTLEDMVEFLGDCFSKTVKQYNEIKIKLNDVQIEAKDACDKLEESKKKESKHLAMVNTRLVSRLNTKEKQVKKAHEGTIAKVVKAGNKVRTTWKKKLIATQYKLKAANKEIKYLKKEGEAMVLDVQAEMVNHYETIVSKLRHTNHTLQAHVNAFDILFHSEEI
jgi:chromosome segregation ATPase